MKTTELYFVGDRSQSMETMGDAPWKGVRDWANEQAAKAVENNLDTRITIVTFDDEMTCVLDSISTSNWVDITEKTAKKWMRPRGCTRLYDTVIETLETLIQKKKTQGEVEGGECEAIFSLFTDGKDNVSNRSLSEMNRVVTNARDQGIVCYFLAANQDAIATGHRYGFDKKRCLTTGTDPKTASRAYKTISDACLRTTHTPHLDKGFSQLERLYSAP